ncbi:hypothetical protein A2U01_0067868, partial [Trifolium medium]|nr:hypothetical protein [Trifolium medium]
MKEPYLAAIPIREKQRSSFQATSVVAAMVNP